MALYVDSAYLDDIINVARTVPLAGVTTNPSILLDAHRRGQELTPQALLEQLLNTISGIIFMQPSIVDEESAYREAVAYIEIASERVIPKIPITYAGMRVAQRLRIQGCRVAFTAVTTVSQAYSATMAGADYIIPYYNRMRRSGIVAEERLAHMLKATQEQKQPPRILAASIKSAAEACEAILAGAHDLTAPPQVLLDMISNPETEQAVEQFEQDYQKMKKL